MRALYDDAVTNGLVILPPDVNASNYRFEPVDGRRIRYGLGGIKGTGEQAVAAIVAARESGGVFLDLFDFCRRADKRHVNRRAVEALIRGGAFDSVDPRRSMLFASVGIALSEAEKAERSAAQVSLFGDSREEAGHALVAYQTAYFKAHHAAAFMAANLSLVMDDTDKVRSLYADAVDQGLAILPPDVNASAWRFEPVDAKRIRYGLGGIKGTGQGAIEAILAARPCRRAVLRSLRPLRARRQAPDQSPRAVIKGLSQPGRL